MGSSCVSFLRYFVVKHVMYLSASRQSSYTSESSSSASYSRPVCLSGFSEFSLACILFWCVHVVAVVVAARKRKTERATVSEASLHSGESKRRTRKENPPRRCKGSWPWESG